MPESSSTSPTSTADELRRLADHPLLGHRSDQLRALADDLADVDRLQRWVDVDLFAAFEVSTDDDVPLPDETSRTLRWLEAARGVLIFFPLVVTWAGVASAATGYARLIDVDPEAASTSFLALWESGFDGHAPLGLTLWRVAILDVMFIVCLIAASLVAGRLRNRRERRLHEEARSLRSELASVLVDVGLRLGEVRLSSPARFQAELSKSAELMATWHEKAVAATEPTAAAALELSTASRELVGTIETVRAANATMGDQIDALTAQVKELTESEAQLRDRLDTLFADHAAVQEESRRTRASLEQVVTSTGQLLQALEQEAQRSSSAATSALEESRRIVELAEAARDAQANLTSAVEKLVVQVGDATAAITGVSTSLQSAGSAFETTVLSTSDALGRASAALEASVSSTGEALGRASAAIEGAAASEQSVAEHLRKASASVEFSMGTVREDLEALGALVGQLVESFRQLAEEIERLRDAEPPAA